MSRPKFELPPEGLPPEVLEVMREQLDAFGRECVMEGFCAGLDIALTRPVRIAAISSFLGKADPTPGPGVSRSLCSKWVTRMRANMGLPPLHPNKARAGRVKKGAPKL